MARLRRTLALPAALAAVLALLAPAAASARPTATQRSRGAVSSLPPQGLYEECAPSTGAQCAAELSQIGAAGFRLVLDYSAWEGTATQIQAYAAEAAADGVQVIWPLNDAAWLAPPTATALLSEYPSLAATCGCSDDQGFLQYAVDLTRGDAATWGWYVGDELAPQQAASAEALATAVRGLDPSHPTLYVASANTGNPLANLRPFASVANVLGADIYPIGQDVPASYVSISAGDVRRVSAAAHVRSAMVLQAFNWADYPTELDAPDPRWPSEGQMLTMRDAALTADPSLILWYSYEDLSQSADPARHWNALVSAAFAPVPAPLTHR
jgi:hypothetical protein